MRRSAHFWIGLLCSAVVGLPAPSNAQDRVSFEHAGVRIVGVPKPADRTFDIDVANPTAGADLIREALDILRAGSRYNAQAIDRLKANGNVVIIYNPAFPQRELSQITIAAFFPDYFKKGTDTKDFVTVVGRYGGKWSARDLAPVLAHELTGHGMQHLRGRLEHVRVVDLECEAYLYQEKAYQDLGFDKQEREIVNFRQQLERHWCADFRRWQATARPQNAALWDTLNPDVPKILDDYLAYIESLRQSGVAGAAIGKASAARAEATRAQIAALKERAGPDDHYQVARIYLGGMGIDQDKAEGLKWLRAAAQQGHTRAQFELSRAASTGEGMSQNKAEAAEWARKAAEGGHRKAAYIYGAMLVNGDGVTRNRQAGIDWLKRAADGGDQAARDALGKLGVGN